MSWQLPHKPLFTDTEERVQTQGRTHTAASLTQILWPHVLSSQTQRNHSVTPELILLFKVMAHEVILRNSLHVQTMFPHIKQQLWEIYSINQSSCSCTVSEYSWSQAVSTSRKQPWWRCNLAPVVAALASIVPSFCSVRKDVIPSYSSRRGCLKLSYQGPWIRLCKKTSCRENKVLDFVAVGMLQVLILSAEDRQPVSLLQ